MANPVAGFGGDFHGGEIVQNMEKVLVRQGLVSGTGSGESLQGAVTPAALAV